MKHKISAEWRIILVACGIMLVFAGFASAEEPTQQFNKLRLDPLYREQLIDGTDYNYTLQVQPPDGFTNVESAIVTFQVWHNPSITYYLWVDGQTCNNAEFYVSTTYANAGEGTIYFDCSNIITKAGTYTITLQTDDDTGTVTAWSDLTYTNKPRADVEVYGTEYLQGDAVTVWLQLLDADQQAVNNATCFSTVWYPDKTSWFTNSVMTYQSASNGIYYIDATAQDQTGVYMVDAVCQYTTEDVFYNATSVEIINATYISGTNSSVTHSDEDRYVVDESGTPKIEGFEVLMHMRFDETSGTDASDSSAQDVTGTYINSPLLTEPGIENTGTYFDGVNEYVEITDITSEWIVASDEDIGFCFGINASDDIRNTERIFDFRGGTGFSMVGDDDELLWIVDRSVDGGEDIKTATHFDDNTWHRVCFFTDIVAEDMYAYVDGVLDKVQGRTQAGTITFPPDPTVAVDDTLSQWFDGGLDELCLMKGTDINYTLIVDEFQQGNCGVSVEDNRTLDIEINIPNVVVSPNLDVFSILTEYQWTGAAEDLIVEVYNQSGGGWVTLTNGLTYTLVDSVISSELVGNQSDYVDGSGNVLVRYHDPLSVDDDVHRFSVNQVAVISHQHVSIPITEVRGGGEVHVNNVTKYSEAVWNYVDRQLTEFNFDVTDEEEIWNYANRTLTESVALTNVTIADIGDQVWGYPDRNLTYYQSFENFSAANVWSYENRSLTTFGTLIADIWSYVTRTITAFPFDVVDEELIGEYTWNSTTNGRYTHGIVLS